MLAEVGLVGLVAFSTVVIPSSVPRAIAGPPACADTDADWLCDTAEAPYGDTDGDSLPNWNDPDDDGDGIPTILEHADPSDEGDPRDARDRDRDGQPDWLDAPTLPTDGWASVEQKISDTAGGFAGILNGSDAFHVATAIGDVDGDGVVDLAVGAPGDDDGQANAGAVYVLFLNVNGTVRAEQKISDTDGGLAAVLDAGDEFGFAVAGVGDLDGDGIGEVAVGVRSDDDGGSARGAVFVLFLNANGTVRAEQKISDTAGGLAATLSNGGEFGAGVTGVGDLDADGLPDLAVGARLGDDGGLDRGEVHVLFLNANGTVRAEQKISDTTGGLAVTLDNGANFGHGLAGPGDIDGDGVEDLVVGAPLGDGGGADRGEVHVLFLNANGTVRTEQEISATAGGLGGLLRDGDRFGSAVTGLGDLDGDGVADLAIGAADDDDHGIDKGAVHLVALTASGTVGDRWTLSEVDGNFAGSLDDADGFGGAVTGLGDLDGDGDLDLAVGAAGDDDGGIDRGAVYVIALTRAVDTDGDGLYDHRELLFGDTDGDSLPNWNDPDDDGDGVPTSLEGADPDGDGDPRDARDRDRDGQPDHRDVPTTSTSGTVASEQKISELVGGFATTLTNTDQFGAEVTAIGDLDGDGIVDLAVGANLDNGGGFDRGAMYVLFMNADGTVRAEQEISDVQGGLTEVIDDGDYFGRSIAVIGDLDGDGIPDLAVGAPFDDDGGPDRGAVHVLFMNSNGTVRDEEKISDIDGGLAAVLDDLDLFGLAVEGIGDLDGDGFPDLAVGARNDDDGGPDRGAVHVLFMNPDGTVRAEQKISDSQGGLTANLANSDFFGVAVAALGDLDGDGIGDLAVGARNDDDGGPDTGAVHVLFMNPDGTVRAEQKISDTVGAVPPMLALDDFDWFGSGLAGLGDLDGDGRPDLAVGAWRSDDGGTDRGALHVLFLNTDGTVRDESVISDTQGGLTAALDDGDQFGGSVTGLGDLDGDGTIGIAVGAFLDDDGGADRGAVYVLDLQPPAPAIVNSTGDAGDATPGDGVCWTGANNSAGNPACTLRAAIQEANAGVADTIHFDIPPTEPGYSVVTGVWTIAMSTSVPVITSPVEIVGATQTINRGDTNPGTLGLSRAVGTGPDGVVGSGDEPTVDGVAAPEIEIDFDAAGFRIESSGVEIGGLAMFGGNADVWIQSGTGAVVADNVIGTRASSFSDPGPPARSTGTGGVAVAGGSDVSIVGNLIGFQSERGINVFGNAVDVAISGNEIRSTGMATAVEGGGIELTNFYVVGTALTGVTITGNLITGSIADFGIEVATDAGDSGIVIRDNTVLGNSVLFYGDQNPDGGMLRNNEIRNADLDGVLVDGVSGWSILGNSITGSATLGIALFSGANDALTAPTIDAAQSDGSTIDVDVTVVAPAGTYRVEFFANTVADPSGFGEGERFVGSTTITHAGGSGAYSATIASTGGGFLAATLTVDEGAGAFGSTSAFSNSRAVACADTDADGLCDAEEDANTDADGNPTTNPGPDTDGDSLPNHLDADDDGDGVATSLENADPNGDGDPRDARDSDRDGQPDWLDTEAGPSSTPVADEQKISATAGGLIGPLDDSDNLGQDVTGIGDLDGDGISDLAVGVPEDDDGGINRGAVYVLFMNADGTVRDEQKISDTAGGFAGALDDFDEFGHGLASLGDLDGDGVTDIAVGTWSDDDGGPARGAVWILFLERDGTVKGHRKISDTTGGLVAALDDDDVFGSSLTGPGDVDGDGTPDLAVGARWDDDGGTDNGAAFILFLNSDGTVRAEQKISDTAGGLTGVLDDFDEFGHDVAGIGDLDGDGIGDLAVGVPRDDDGGADRGASYVLFLNADGTVRAEQKLSAAAGPLAAALDDDDWFGSAVAGVGDLDGNGRPDLAVGARGDTDGASNAGAVHLLRLAADGTIVGADKISATTGGLAGPLDFFDHFGRGISSLGDLDDDGTLNLAVSARYDDDGGTDRGAVYVLDLAPPATAVVNSTGDAVDNAPGDGICWTGGTNSQGRPACTLRAAVQEANAHPVIAAIHVDIPVTDPGHSAGVWTVAPTTALPAITAPVVLDATTQPGWTATPVVELDGSSAGAAVDGLTLATGSGGSEVRGLAIGGFSREGISILPGSDGNRIAGNHLGTDASGAVDAGNASSGIYVQSDGNTIGGTVAQDRNVISGNDGYGIYFGWTANNTVVGNHIGVDRTGNAPLGNTFNGVFVSGTGHVIGGSAAGARNVFGDHGDIAVRIETGSGHRVLGNSIGVGADGSTVLGNAIGVSVRFGATDVVIGGTAPGEGNTIRNNAKGVLIHDAATDDVAVIGNAISANGGLGIDFEDDGVTANDAGDVDTGANGLLNFPVITGAVETAGTIDLDVELDVPAGTYRIEVFTNPSGADPSGHGEGEQLVHSFTAIHGGAGVASFTTSFAGGAGATLTATATEDLAGGGFGSTSEFSAAVVLCRDADSDGLCDHFEDLYGDTDGDLVVNRLDPDDDGDGIATASEHADPSGDGDPRDARDSDRDGQPDWLDRPTVVTQPTVVAEQKISGVAGGLAATLDDGDEFSSLTSIGDLDRDGVVDLVVAAYRDDDGGSNRGALYVLFMNTDGTVRAEQKISSTIGGFGAGLDNGDQLGWAVTGLGDLDGDGIADLAAGATLDDDGGSARGAVWILFLNANGTVKARQKISDTTGGLAAVLDDGDEFGSEISPLGDLDGDGITELVVTARGDDDGGTDRGAAYVLFLNADGTVRAEQKISDTSGGLAAALDDGAEFGYGVAGLGDLDGDGIGDLGVGAWTADLGGTDRGAVYVLRLNADGTVKGEQVIASGTGGFGSLDDGDLLGADLSGIGDVDLDGLPDLVIGAAGDDDGGGDAGAVYVVSLTSTGAVARRAKISQSSGGFVGPLSPGAGFGDRTAGLGDLDGDGAIDIAVGAWGQDDGGTDRGAVFVLRLRPTGCIGDTDGDGLRDCEEDANADADDDHTTNPGPDTDGDSLPNWNDPDDDGDGLPTALENADPNGDGDPRDARDRDRDGQPDWLDVEAAPSTTPIVHEQKISDLAGGLAAPLGNQSMFGAAVAGIGDVDRDGVVDLAVGSFSSVGGTMRGAVYVLFMNADGTVRAEQEISAATGGLAAPLDDFDVFGHGVAGLGDLDGDGTPDLAVGAFNDDDGGTNRGAVYVLFLNPDGTVRAERKISDVTGGLVATLDDGDRFGVSVDGMGDLDGDGVPDLVVGADEDDDGGTNRGAVYVLFLNPDGTVRAEQKISDTAGGLVGALDDGDGFGRSVGAIGDVDADGRADLAAGVEFDDDGGTDRGAVHVLFLNADGTVRDEQKISSTSGGLAPLSNADRFGIGVTGIGDLDGDGRPDLAIGIYGADDAGSERGAAVLLRLAADGTVIGESRISATSGGLSGPLDDGDRFGSDVGGLGDLDGDGALDLVVSARHDDDGGFDRGAVYVLDLGAPVLSNIVTVNSTGDGTDQNPGDGICSTGGLNSAGDTECTLRAAIREANASALIDTIHFDIPTSDPNHVAGTWTIRPTAGSALPGINQPVTIDATTQPGTVVNTAVAPAPMNGRLAIELSGANDLVTSNWDALVINVGASGSVVRGLAIVDWRNGTSDGILMWNSANNVIAGNYFGIRADGTTDQVGNNASVGMSNNSSGNRVGGTAAADRNLFSGATPSGGSGWSLVWVSGISVGNVVQGNEMGFTIGGSPATAANAIGVAVLGGGVTVGGTVPGATNRIFGGWYGVSVDDSQGASTAAILGNRIWGQSVLSIDHDADGHTANDPLDVDAGPNGLLNHPVLVTADADAGGVTVAYDLDVPAGDYRVEFFTSAAAHPTGYGPGEQLVHVATVTHAGGGNRAFTAAFAAAPGAVVTATVTEIIGVGQFGATSEFSNAMVPIAAGARVVDHSGRRIDLDALGGADGAAPAVGNTGSAVELEGGAERLVAPTFDVTAPELTVSGWVRLDAAAGDPRLVSRSTGGTTILDVFVSGTSATARLGFGGAPVEASGGTITLATWHQIAASWDGTTLVLFVDGDPVDTAAAGGALPTVPAAPLVVGNTERGDHGLDGRIDDVRIAHTARSADWIRTEYLNLTQPDRFVTLGVSQTAPPGAWAASTAQARTGSYALAAPVTPAGADAWATARGIDEPGLVVDAWWRLTDPGAARVATGTSTGVVPVDQLETGITFGAVDLATQAGVTRTVDDTAMFGSSFTTWTRVEMRTDELGRSTALVDGTVVAGPTLHSGGPSRGSAGLRAAQLTIGQAYVDDVRIRRYVSDEPTATLGPLLRQ